MKLVAKLAEGGMRDALSILEQCLAYNDKLSIDSVNKVYGLLSMDNKIIFIKITFTGFKICFTITG